LLNSTVAAAFLVGVTGASAGETSQAAIGSNQQEAWDFRLGPDGKAWTFAGNVLVRIDPRDASIEPAGGLARPGPLAFSGGRIYLGVTPAVRRIREAPPATPRR